MRQGVYEERSESCSRVARLRDPRTRTLQQGELLLLLPPGVLSSVVCRPTSTEYKLVTRLWAFRLRDSLCFQDSSSIQEFREFRVIPVYIYLLVRSYVYIFLCKVYVGDLIGKRHLISAEINIEVQCFIFFFFFFFIEWFNKIIPFNKENFMIEKFF